MDLLHLSLHQDEVTPPLRLDWWYWIASAYGESVAQAFVVLVILMTAFACGYTKVGFDQATKVVTPIVQVQVISSTGQIVSGVTSPPSQTRIADKPLSWGDALLYSANLCILQRPEPKPYTLSAKILVFAETLLGPAQAALFALALRRRFMR